MSRLRTITEIIRKVQNELDLLYVELENERNNDIRKKNLNNEIAHLRAYVSMLSGGDPAPYLESFARLNKGRE